MISVFPLGNWYQIHAAFISCVFFIYLERPQSPSHDKDGVKSGDVKSGVSSSPAKPGDSPAPGQGMVTLCISFY